MTWYEILLAFIAGLGSFKLIDFLTIKSRRKQAGAEADKVVAEAKKINAEADIIGANKTQKIIDMWEDLVDKKAKADAEQIESLNNRIIDLENLVRSFQKTVDKFTKAINKAKECPGAESCIALKELDKTSQSEK